MLFIQRHINSPSSACSFHSPSHLPWEDTTWVSFNLQLILLTRLLSHHCLKRYLPIYGWVDWSNVGSIPCPRTLHVAPARALISDIIHVISWYTVLHKKVQVDFTQFSQRPRVTDPDPGSCQVCQMVLGLICPCRASVIGKYLFPMMRLCKGGGPRLLAPFGIWPFAPGSPNYFSWRSPKFFFVLPK